MRLIHGLLILLLPIVVLAGSDHEKLVSQKPTKWVPIYGYKHPTTKAYIDSNSVSRKASESGGDFGSAGILMVSLEPVPMPFDGKIILVKSIVKHMIIDCKSGMLAPAVDFFFSVDRPTRKDIPIGALRYSDLAGAETVSKTSLTYTVLCPTYI